MPDIPIPPGSLIFFSFLEDDSWFDRTGVRFDRSLAVRRQVRIHRPLYVGDQVSGSPTITAVECKEKETSVMVFVTIGTVYESEGEAAVEELVTYMTRHPRGTDG
jgi:hydroxyacyl-ACP dehydratase HTD2-like protein with hotdog domain